MPRCCLLIQFFPITVRIFQCQPLQLYGSGTSHEESCFSMHFLYLTFFQSVMVTFSQQLILCAPRCFEFRDSSFHIPTIFFPADVQSLNECFEMEISMHYVSFQVFTSAASTSSIVPLTMPAAYLMLGRGTYLWHVPVIELALV